MMASGISLAWARVSLYQSAKRTSLAAGALNTVPVTTAVAGVLLAAEAAFFFSADSRALRVCSPAMPSAFSLAAVWKAFTAR